METMTATTITISNDLKRELLRVAAELQASRREKIDYDDVLWFLVKKATRNLDLFHQACRPTGRSSEHLKRALRKGRTEDKNSVKLMFLESQRLPRPMRVKSRRAKWGRKTFPDAGEATFSD